jgi:hypothetical protein
LPEAMVIPVRPVSAPALSEPVPSVRVPPVIVPEAFTVVAPETAPAVVTLRPVDVIATVLEAPPILTPPLEVPVPMFTAKLEEALRLTTPPVIVCPVEPVIKPLTVSVPAETARLPPLTVSPACAVISPEKVGAFATFKVTVVVPDFVMLVPAVTKELRSTKLGAEDPFEVKIWLERPPTKAVVEGADW